MICPSIVPNSSMYNVNLAKEPAGQGSRDWWIREFWTYLVSFKLGERKKSFL